jgi:gas vesicle protein
MKKSDSFEGLMVGFSIGFLYALLTTPKKGLIYTSNKNMNLHEFWSSFFKVFESIFTISMSRNADGSAKRSEK